MGFQISAVGTRAGVIKAINDAKTPAPTDDQAQLVAAKIFLTAEVESLPAEFNGVQITVDADAHQGARSMQMTIIPRKLHV
jgi:hypothetical protein